MAGKIEIKESDRLVFQSGQRRGSLAERFGSGAKKKDDKVQEIDEAENIEIARVYELRSFEHPFSKTVDKDIESLAESIKEDTQYILMKMGMKIGNGRNRKYLIRLIIKLKKNF